MTLAGSVSKRVTTRRRRDLTETATRDEPDEPKWSLSHQCNHQGSPSCSSIHLTTILLSMVAWVHLTVLFLGWARAVLARALHLRSSVQCCCCCCFSPRP